MNRSTTLRRGVAATVAAAGLAVGGIGIASAAGDDQPNDRISSTGASAASDGDGDHRGAHRHGQRSPGNVSSLAEALDVTEADLRSAFQSLREGHEPSQDGDRSTPPTDAEREQQHEQRANALAAELDGVSAEQVTAAVEEITSDKRAEARTELAGRLSEAVTAGDLTSADRTSVLKAFDAKVLGGR